MPGYPAERLSLSLLDGDGTLVDSRLPIQQSTNPALGHFDLPPIEASSLPEIIGPTFKGGDTRIASPARCSASSCRTHLEGNSATTVQTCPSSRRHLPTGSGNARTALITSTNGRGHIETNGIRTTDSPSRGAGGFEVVEGMGLARAEPNLVTLDRALSMMKADSSGASAAMIGDCHHDIAAGKAMGS